MAGYVSPEGAFRLGLDPMDGALTELVTSGKVEVIDPDILCLPKGTIEFRDGDDYAVVTKEDGTYTREWPSEAAYCRYVISRRSKS